MDIGFIPPSILGRLSQDPLRRAHWNTLASSMVVVLLFMIPPTVPKLLCKIPHVCLFAWMTGYPCPGCGVLRSLQAFFQGDFAQARAFHPAGPVLGILLLAQAPFRLWALAAPESRAAIAATVSQTSNRLGLLALLGGWLLKLHH